VIAVKDVPGFYVNRCIGPMATEALGCVQQGVDPVQLNEAMLAFGYPVGPVFLLDEVGIDVTTKVVYNLIGEQPRYLGVRMEGADLSMMKDFVAAGLLGKKTGKGFFDHSAKGKGKGPKPVHPEAQEIIAKYRHPTKDYSNAPIDDAVERVVMRFVLEAVHCLESGVISSARDGDIGAVFGVGFPPFRGGPFMWIDTVGPQVIVDKCRALEAEHGAQFAPPQLLVEKAAKGELFHQPEP